MYDRQCGTWLGVHVQRQQHPCCEFQLGKWKTSEKNFQSPRSSTSAARTPKSPLWAARLALLQSDFHHSLPSRRPRGHTLAAQRWKDHAKTEKISPLVSSAMIFLLQAIKGMRSGCRLPD